METMDSRRISIKFPLTIILIIFSASCSGSKVLHFNLREELPTGTFVGSVKDESNITAIVPFDQVHRLRFEFRHTTSLPYRYFTLDEQKGVIRTAQVIDREVICLHKVICDLEMDVKVKPVEYFQVFKIVVRIEDVNDNVPTFPSDRIEIEVAETSQPGALFLVPTAVDADSGTLGVQEYQLMTSTDTFVLKVADYMDGSKDIRLQLMERLDREEEAQYTMTVLAIDGGRPRKTGSVILDIIVLDSNDNNPRFENSSYGVVIYENLPPGSLVAVVKATDPDAGQSGVVTYSLADFTEKEYGNIFRIDERTGEIYLKEEVDYETAKSFQLTVIATDLGTGSLPAFAKVTIDVVDLNDNPPEITVNVLTESGMAEVRENTEPGAFVAHAAVKDVDGGRGGMTSCSIDGRGKFKLEKLYDSEYKLVTLVSFDREEGAYHTVILTCKDNGDPSLTSTASIRISILDENDHHPQLSTDTFTGEIPENSSPGFHVLTINASDADAGKNGALLYRLRPMNGTPENCAEIDPITGAIKTIRMFDYEDRKEYRFLVTVFDHGSPRNSATGTVIIFVTDLNDEKPKFSQNSYQFQTAELQPVGTIVGSVSATDSDISDDYKRVNYRIEYEQDVPFEIHSVSGTIFNSRIVDRELIPSHRFTVVAFNPGYPLSESRTNITIDIIDVNDHNPVFVFPGNEGETVEIAGSAGVGALVTRVVASDADEGRNAEISYSISHNDADGLFDINPSTGVIILAKELEESELNRLYKLVVVARDNGDPSLTGFRTLRIISNATSALKPTKSSAAFLTSESFLTSTYFVIIVGASAGFILVVLLLVLAIVCVKRHNRRIRNKLIDQILASGSQCSHQCQSPVCSSMAMSRNKNDGSLSTMDSCSMKSSTLPVCSHHRQTPDYRGLRLEEDDEGSELGYADPWNHRGSKVLANTHISAMESAIPGGTPPCYRGSARYAQGRDRSRSPMPLYPGGGGVAARSCSNCSCSSCQISRAYASSSGSNHHRHSVTKQHRSRKQSPHQYIPMQVRVPTSDKRRPPGVLDGEGGPGQDTGSVGSWSDSGRGPSEEEDPHKLQLDPLIKVSSACCNSACHHRHQNHHHVNRLQQEQRRSLSGTL